MKKKTSILMLMLVAIMAITLVGCGKSDNTSKKDSGKKETTVVSDKNDKTPVDDTDADDKKEVTETPTEAPTEPEKPKDYRYDVEKIMSSSKFENASFLVNEDGMVIARAPYSKYGNVTPIGERYGVSVMSTYDDLYSCYVDNEPTFFSTTAITELGLDDGYYELKANDESNLQFCEIVIDNNEFHWNEDHTAIDKEIADIYVLAQVTNSDEIAKYAALAGYDNPVVVKVYYSTSTEKTSSVNHSCDIADMKRLIECENAFTVTYIIDEPSEYWHLVNLELDKIL